MRYLLYFIIVATIVLAVITPVHGDALLPIANTSVTMTTITQGPYETIMLAIGGSGNNTTSIDWAAILYQLPTPWYNQLGPFAFLIMAMIPFSMIWIRTSSTLMIATLALILGAFFFALVPAEFAAIAVVVVVFMIAAQYFYFFKKRS